MAGDKSFRKLPEVLRTPAQKRFFDATVEQLFSKKDSKHVNGFIGRRKPGYFDPKNDYYLEQINKERTWNLLEPMALSYDNATLEESNEVFYEDLLNRIEALNGNTSNQDKMFSSEFYSFAPPIDIDKFVNFSAYYWVPNLPTIDLPGIDDAEIQANILDHANYTYVDPNGVETELVFTDRVKVSFSSSVDYQESYFVCGVGAGIYLVKETELQAKTFTPDYITIELGAPDGNAWSRSNNWIHKTTINMISQRFNVELFTTGTQGRRPIIEFDRDLELYNSGTNFLTDVDLTSSSSFASIHNQILPTFADGIELKQDDLLIFLTDISDYKMYSGFESFMAYSAPFQFVLSNPVTDKDDMYVVVKRYKDNTTSPELFYNPSWYSLEDQNNMMGFTVHTNGLYEDETTTYDSDGIGTTFVAEQEYLEVIRSVEVVVDGTVMIEGYDYTVEIEEPYAEVTLLTPPPQGSGIVSVILSDTVYGLLDGEDLEIGEHDIVNVYTNADVESLTEVGTDTESNYVFESAIENLAITDLIGITISNIEGYTNKKYDYAPGETDNSVIKSVTFVNQNIIVELASNLPADAELSVVVGRSRPVTVSVSEYIWKAVPQEKYEYYTVGNPNTGEGTTTVVKKETQVLVPYPDIDTPVNAGDNVYVKYGKTNADKDFYYTGKQWEQSFNIKSGINQAPLFNLYYTMLDDNGDPLPLSDLPGSNFAGSEIFSYKKDPLNAIVDSVLGFSVEYKNLGQVADIVFEHDLETVRYKQLVNGELEEIPGYYYFKRTNPGIHGGFNYQYEHTWTPFATHSKQRVIDRYPIQVDGELLFELSVTPNKMANGLYDVTANYSDNMLTQGPQPEDITAAYEFDYFVLLDGAGNPTKNVVVNTTLNDINANQVIEFKTWSDEVLDDSLSGYYEIPKQLENNPSNEEVTEYSLNEFTEHFTSIMANQENIEGEVLSSKNNYRDTKEDLSLGSLILQTKGPLLKPMFMISEEHLDITYAIEFAKKEYTRYKDKLVNTARQLVREAWQPSSQIENNNNEQAFNEVIERVSNTTEYFKAFELSFMLDWGTSHTSQVFTSLENASTSTSKITVDGVLELNTEIDLSTFKNGILLYESSDTTTDSLMVIDREYTIVSNKAIQLIDYDSTFDGSIVVRYYEDPVPAIVPPTPARLGCANTYQPGIELDTSYLTPTYVILGHDGSKTPMYTDIEVIEYIIANIANDPSVEQNLDLRDRILLSFEERIYNHTVDKFRNDYDLMLTEEDIRPGAFRDTRYSQDEYNDIVRANLIKWASNTQTNYKIHSEFDPGNWMTWNYKVSNPNLPGHWKGIYKYYYDTTEPALKPWEMLGFSIAPQWWTEEYGSDYTSANIEMWQDLELGYIRQGNRQGFDSRYARSGLLGIIPVSSTGDLLSPHQIGIAAEPSTDDDKSADWVFGDMGPVEEAWTNTSEYRYSLMQTQFLMRPGIFSETLWNPLDLMDAPISPDQVVSVSTMTRTGTADTIVHGEEVGDDTVVKHGYQQIISDYILFYGKDITTDFGNYVRNLDVKLGHRLGGFTNRDTLSVFTEGAASGSSNINLKIPDENIAVKVHKGKTIKEYVYSGVAIIINENYEFEVRGYDLLTPEFKVYGRDKNSIAQQVSVGGTPVDFRTFRSSDTYTIGEYVKYNTNFYQSVKAQTVDKFTDGEWSYIKNLPSTGGATVSYIKDADEDNIYTVDYSTRFTTAQEVFDFLIGHGDYLESQGWVFDNVVSDTNTLENWFNSAKDFLFWSTSNWSPGNSLFISPGAQKINLTVSQGYVDNIEKITNGVYGILDEYGYAIQPKYTQVNRDNQDIEVLTTDPTTGIYGLRVAAKETEHIIMFDNYTVFNDIIYNPLLSSRQRRLELKGFRTSNWIGKYEADGYIIQGDKLLQNYENITDSIRDYYNSEVTLDNSVIEDTARHLIGYQNRDYLEDLKLFGDTQYKFYKGMIPEKGSIQPVDKLLRSSFIQGSKETSIYEDWAFKRGEFGAVNNNTYQEFLIDNNDLKSDPQLVELVYSDDTNVAENRYIHSIVLTNAETIYESAPNIVIYPAEGDVPTKQAFATATLDSTGRLSSIDVTEPGAGYINEPSIVMQTTGTEETADTAFAVLRNTIAYDDKNDDVIVIDVDDVDKWLKRPHGQRFDEFIPTTKLDDVDGIVPFAGYVHYDDIDYTSFNDDGLFSIWETSTSTPVEDEYIWVANAEKYNTLWFVLRIIEATDMTNNAIDKVSGDGTLYTYTSNNGIISTLATSDGTLVWDTDNGIDDVDPATWTTTLIFANARVSTPQYSGKEWVDDYNGKWAVLENGNPIRQEEPLVNSKLFENAFVYTKDTGTTLVNMPIYDPFKGFIPGIADRNITYKSDIDPSRYTYASSQSYVNDDLALDGNNVGELWWDTSTCRYAYYEQGTAEYRKNNWGNLVPGSTVDVYEWVSSNYSPEDYDGNGTPRNTTDYVERIEYNQLYNSYTTTYYFWVKNKTTIPDNIARRTMSSMNVSRLIENPRNQGYAWMSYIDTNHFIFNNINSIINSLETVMQINYRFNDTDNPIHTEWELITENSPTTTGKITDSLWDKLVDSLVQYDKEGRYVPDPNLSEFEKYGTDVRPRQSWFKDVQQARKTFVENVNPNLKKINLRDTTSWESEFISTNNYWQYDDWYADGYTKDNTIPTLQILSNREDDSFGAPPPTTFTKEQEALLSEGDIVKIVELNNSAYYYYNGVTLSDIVRREKTALQIKSTLYTDINLIALSTELREILEAIKNYVFINDDYYKLNDTFFAMVNYVAFEQKQVDWFFKTSYIQILQEGQSIGYQPKSFTPDSLSSLIEYVNEVKPYQTKVRDYVTSISGYVDEAYGRAWDMDHVLYEVEDGDTKYYDPSEWETDPNTLIRYIDTMSTYDSIQCGTIDKEYNLELKRINLVGDGVKSQWILDSIEAATKILINGKTLSKSAFWTEEEIDTRNLILNFKVAPAEGDDILIISKITFVHSELEEMRLLYNTGRQSTTSVETFIGDDRTDTFELNETFGLSITDVAITIDDVEISSGAYSISYSGIRAYIEFITPPETDATVTISYAINNKTDIKLVGFDLELSNDNKIRSGWGVAQWDTIGWNAPGHSVQTDPELIHRFKVHSGATNRYIKMQTDLTPDIYKFVTNGNDLRYSAYTNVNSSHIPTEAELYSLVEFNKRYANYYECTFQGMYIDAETFDYILSEPWDSTSWDTERWDKQIPMAIIDAASSTDDNKIAIFKGNGKNNIAKIPYAVNVSQVGQGDNVLVKDTDYTVELILGSTHITFTTPPAVGTLLSIVYNHLSDDNFDTNLGAMALDGHEFTPKSHDAGITDELAVYDATENVVINVSTNTEEVVEEFKGNRLDTIFEFTQNKDRGVVINSVTIDNIEVYNYTLTIIAPTGNYAIKFDTAPDTDVTIAVTYKVGTLQQYYEAHDSAHYDTMPHTPLYIDNQPTYISVVTSSYDSVAYDTEDRNSSYLLPVPFVADETAKSIEQFKNSIKIYVVSLDSDRVTNYIPQVADIDYTMVTVTMYIDSLSQTGLTDDEITQALSMYRSAYTNYIQEFYPGISDDDTDAFEAIFNKSILLFFNEQHTNRGIGNTSQAILVDYELNDVEYKVHLSEMDSNTAIRIIDSTTTTLAEYVTYDSRSIKVADATKLDPIDDSGVSVAWIGNERITYTGIDGNTLKGITRQTNGTSIDATRNPTGDANTTYEPGTDIVAGGAHHEIPNLNSPMWSNSIGGIGLSTTEQSLFLRT